MDYFANPSTQPIRGAMAAGHLRAILTPKQGNRLPGGVRWCADNGCFGKGWPGETPASACEHLSYENQHIVTSTLSEIAKLDGFEESVMVVG